MGLLGSLFGGSTTTTSKSEPWKPQGQALQFAFNEAQNLYNTKKGSSWYTGDLHAGLDPLTQQGIYNTGLYTQGAGQDGANQVAGTASSLLTGASGDYLDSIRSYAGRASGDPTEGNIAAAGRYASNPFLDQQIDAVGADIRRNLGENIMPSIDRQATATGGINSTRAGVAEGIAARGASEAFARTAGDMRSQAYQDGLGLAESARSTNLGHEGNAAGLYGSAVGQGMSGVNQGQQMNLQLLDTLVKSGQISQEDAQRAMDSELMRWSGNDTRDADLLNQYYGIIGSNNWGGTQTQTQKTQGSILGGALGIASTLGGLGWKPF